MPRNHTDTLRQALADLLRSQSVAIGTFTLASGRNSSYYIDARRTTMSAQGLQLIGDLGLQEIRRAGWDAEAVGGLTLGADPVAYAIARASVAAPPIVQAFTVRKAAKPHGGKRRIEGCFAPGMAVVVVEDVVTSGQSALHAIDALAAEGARVSGVLAVVDRDEGGRGAIERAGYPLRSLIALSDLRLPPEIHQE
ncbi:MAG: orotate phosphoribosyltransferase [Gemmatimonadales bacterium]|jgi:orotate phosphoribosyltransferase